MPKAIELFQQFLPKLSSVEWEPVGFKIRDPSAQFGLQMRNRRGYTYYDSPYIDLQKADLSFTFTYNPTSTNRPTQQMSDACFAAILRGPFLGRTFFATPAEGCAERALRLIVEADSYIKIPIVLSYDGGEIAGIHLPQNMKADSWGFFIPNGTPENAAITAALTLERAKRQEQVLRTTQPPDLAGLEKNLETALAAIAA